MLSASSSIRLVNTENTFSPGRQGIGLHDVSNPHTNSGIQVAADALRLVTVPCLGCGCLLWLIGQAWGRRDLY